MKIEFSGTDDLRQKMLERTGNRAKFIMYIDESRGLVAELFETSTEHGNKAASLGLTPEAFKGAGLCNKILGVWNSGTCVSLFGRDKPADEEEANRLLEEFSTRLEEIFTQK